jgi:hypothetical protein
MSERTAFIPFTIGVCVLTFGWLTGLNLLGADDETLAGAFTLMLPVVGLGGGWLFMRYH